MNTDINRASAKLVINEKKEFSPAFQPGLKCANSSDLTPCEHMCEQSCESTCEDSSNLLPTTRE